VAARAHPSLVPPQLGSGPFAPFGVSYEQQSSEYWSFHHLHIVIAFSRRLREGKGR
jgi:hypothetical protein